MVIRPVIGAATFGAVQEQLERSVPPQAAMMPQFDPSVMGARLMFPSIPPPPPPPSMMVPASVSYIYIICSIYFTNLDIIILCTIATDLQIFKSQVYRYRTLILCLKVSNASTHRLML